MDAEQSKGVAGAFAAFLQTRVDTLRALRLIDLQFNAFLLRLYSGPHGLALVDAPRIIRWRTAQYVERGTVTSLGTAFQKAAAVFADQTGVEGSDLVKIKKAGTRSQTYYIQLKSGPNTVPKDLAVITRELLRRAEAFNRGSVPIYATAYGSKSQISGVVRKYVEAQGIQVLAGRDFWEFISDEPDCIDKVYDIAGQVAATFRDEKGQSLQDVLRETEERLVQEFESEYGSGMEMWRGLLERNS
jgi:hypothetical protein